MKTRQKKSVFARIEASLIVLHEKQLFTTVRSKALTKITINTSELAENTFRVDGWWWNGSCQLRQRCEILLTIEPSWRHWNKPNAAPNHGICMVKSFYLSPWGRRVETSCTGIPILEGEAPTNSCPPHRTFKFLFSIKIWLKDPLFYHFFKNPFFWDISSEKQKFKNPFISPKKFVTLSIHSSQIWNLYHI